MNRLRILSSSRPPALFLTAFALSFAALVASASADPTCAEFVEGPAPATCSYSNSSIGDSYQVIRKVYTGDQGGEAWVEWGKTPAYGTDTEHVAIAANSHEMVTPEIGGEYNTTYYFRLVLRLDDDTYWYGTDNQITTDVDPNPPAAPAAPTTVTATSTPPPDCAVPALRGRTLAGAIKLLGAANCSAGHVTRVWSTRFRKGRVIRSVAPSGTAAGAKVALVVSKGKKPRHHR